MTPILPQTHSFFDSLFSTGLGVGLLIGLMVGLAAGLGVFYAVLRPRFQERLHASGMIEQDLRTRLELAQKQQELLKNHEASLLHQEEKLKDALGQKFELLAQKIFDDKTNRFQDMSSKNLMQILDPLKERLKDFERKVDETYSHERSERGLLRGELNKLMELNQVMSTETHNLTQALKGDNKTQGNWGELILENILDRSGLRQGHEYTVQGMELGLKGQEGQRLLPDVVVHLPGDKHLIVDSKVTLKAFEAYCSATNDEDRQKQAKLHVKSLEDHINNLSSKKYHAAEQLISPDFVILFMPLEPAFALAFQLKPDLFGWAWERNIAIVSPTTLLATLRTVSTLWKQEKQQRNALEIARRGGLLYEKFANLLLDFNSLGDKLSAAQRSHHDMTKKLSEGRGNLISQVEELKELGVKTEKTLPSLQI